MPGHRALGHLEVLRQRLQPEDQVGDRRALIPLVRLYDIDEHVTFSGAQFIKEAIREIARREHVTPDDRLFRDLAPAERAALDRVFPKARNGKH